MANTPNMTNSAPISIRLTPEVAAALMDITSAYASVLSWERRLDYCIAELAQWQNVHHAIYQQQNDALLVQHAYQAHENIVQLIEDSLQEGGNE